jgi:hypothetical protein
MSAHSSHSSDGSEDGLTKFRTSLRRGWLGFVAVATVLILTVLLFAWHPWSGNGAPSGQQQAANAASDGCSGIPLTFILGSSNELINGGVKCEMVGWNIDEGQVVLVASDGTDYTFSSAEAFGFTAKRWRAAGSSAHVTAAFCPPHTVWNGANACN